MKKKLITILLTVCLGVVGFSTLIGCAKNDPFIGVFVYADSDEYGYSLCQATEKLLEADGYNINHYDANWDSAKQLRDFEAAISKNMKLALVALQDYAQGDRMAELAKDKGIQIIFFTREPFDANNNTITKYENTLFIGADNKQAGDLQGTMLAQYLTAHDTYKVEDGTTVNYVLFRGNVGNPAADDRTTRVITKANELLNSRNITLNAISTIDCAWVDSKAKEEMDNLLASRDVSRPTNGTTNNNINLIIGNSDALTLGALNAVTAQKDWNKDQTTFASKSILALGMDASKDAKLAITNKRMAGTIELDVNFNARLLAKASKNAMNGKTGADMATDIGKDETQPINVDGRMVLFDFKTFTGNL